MSRRQRVTTALILAPLPILALLFLPTPWLAALVAAVMLAGLWEWTAFAGLEDKTPRVLFLTANALMIAALVWGGGPSLFTLKLASDIWGCPSPTANRVWKGFWKDRILHFMRK